MRNGGAAHKIRSAAEYIMAMPEGLLIASFPLGLSYHRPFDRERNRFLAPLEMTIRESLMSTSHELLENPNP